VKYLTAATITVALSLALVGCGSDNTTSTSASTSTSTTASPATSATPAARPKKTIADYIADNQIPETPVHKGDPGSPVIHLPTPPGWQSVDETTKLYGAFVLAQPANPADPPTITELFSKLTGNVDPAAIIQYAPGELQNLPGYQGPNNGQPSTLSGFQAWQLSGTYQRDGNTRYAAQKTVVIPSQGALFVLQLNADSPQSDEGALMDAMNVIDAQITIKT
jgi:hypothetical protein